MFLNLEEFEYVEEAPTSVDSKYFEGWLMIEDGDWVSQGKWETKKSIVKHVESDKYYQYELQRSGSYYSEYYYTHQEDDNGVSLDEVKPVEKTVVVTTWEYV